jgi:hypothetical protein
VKVFKYSIATFESFQIFNSNNNIEASLHCDQISEIGTTRAKGFGGYVLPAFTIKNYEDLCDAVKFIEAQEERANRPLD